MTATYTLGVFVLLVLSTLTACRQRANAVLVVNDGRVSVMGNVEFVREGGSMQPKTWVPGNVVVFRTTDEVAGQKGIAGQIYRIQGDGSLQSIGTADLGMTNAQLASRFGVTVTAEVARETPPANVRPDSGQPAATNLDSVVVQERVSPREVKILDRSGTVHDVKIRELSGDGAGFCSQFQREIGSAQAYFEIRRPGDDPSTGPREIAVPLSNLITAERSGALDRWTVVYLWRGQQKTAVGELGKGTVYADSELGEFKLHLDKIVKFEFATPPYSIGRERNPYDAVMTLANGSSMDAIGVHWVENAGQTRRWISGSSHEHGHYHHERLSFSVGEASVTVNLAELGSIEPETEDRLAVVTRSGKRLAGRTRVEGFSGISADGEFFIPLGRVKRIAFNR